MSNLIWQKFESGTQGKKKKKKIEIKNIDQTYRQQHFVSTLDKCLLDKSPPSTLK